MKKEKADRAEVKQRDALVVFGQQPRLEAVLGIEVIDVRGGWIVNSSHDSISLSRYGLSSCRETYRLLRGQSLASAASYCDRVRALRRSPSPAASLSAFPAALSKAT